LPSVNIKIAQEGLIVGSQRLINTVEYFTQNALVKRRDARVSFLDVASRSQLRGTGFFDSSGQLIGLVNVNRNGEVFSYHSQVLQGLLERYISAANK
jgi:hypothetical protein